MPNHFQIIHYRKKCIGCNACVEVAPERWKMSKKDGKSVLIGGKNNKEIYHFKAEETEFEANYLAAKYCPVNVIKIQVNNQI